MNISKQLILLCFFVIAINFQAFSSDRINKEIPVISSLNKSITKATGWLNNPEGQWISRDNRIPAHIPANNAYAKFIDFNQWGVGLDNFVSIEVYNLKYRNKDYDLILKTYNGGRYSYPLIQEEWEDYLEYFFYVLPKGSLEKINLSQTQEIFRLPITYFGHYTENSTSKITTERLSTVLLSNINEGYLEKDYIAERTLAFNIMYKKEDQQVRFMMFEHCIHSKNSSFHFECGGVAHKMESDTDTYYPDGQVNLPARDKLFNHYYFELPLSDFIKLIEIGS